MRHALSITADVVMFDKHGRLLVVSPREHPLDGAWSLPSSFVLASESVLSAAHRTLREKTGLAAGRSQIVGVYSAPDRDPRGRIVSTAFLMAPSSGISQPVVMDKGEVSEVRFMKLEDLDGLGLALDHADIVYGAMKMIIEDSSKWGFSTMRSVQMIAAAAKSFGFWLGDDQL